MSFAPPVNHTEEVIEGVHEGCLDVLQSIFFLQNTTPGPESYWLDIWKASSWARLLWVTLQVAKNVLTQGGFAKCYEFTDLTSGRTYACKLIEKKSLAKPKTQQKVLTSFVFLCCCSYVLQLRSEVKIHSSLRHPYIVKFEHFFEDTENVYLLLEICTQQVPFCLSNTIAIFTQMLKYVFFIPYS